MRALPDDQEDDRLLQMAPGDEEAFTALYRRRQAGIYRFALHMSGSGAVAEDVTQEVFLAVMREARNYDRGRGSVAAYLYGIARNCILRHLERDQRHTPITEEMERAGANGSALDELTRKETIESVRRAILTLPPHYREAVVLCDLNEMDYAEAAVVLGCAVGTVRSRLHRARGMLVEKLRAKGSAGTAPGELKAARCFQ